MSGFRSDGNNGHFGGFGHPQSSTQKNDSSFASSNIFGNRNNGNVNVGNGGFGSSTAPFNNNIGNTFSASASPPSAYFHGQSSVSGPATTAFSGGMSFGSSPNVIMPSANITQPSWGAGFSQTNNSFSGESVSNFNRSKSAAPLFAQHHVQNKPVLDPFRGSVPFSSDGQRPALPGSVAQTTSNTVFSSSSNLLTGNQNSGFPTQSEPKGAFREGGAGNFASFERSQRKSDRSRDHDSTLPTEHVNPFWKGSTASSAPHTSSGQEMTSDHNMGDFRGGRKGTNSARHGKFSHGGDSNNHSNQHGASRDSSGVSFGEEHDPDQNSISFQQQEEMLKSKMEERRKQLQAKIEEKKRRLAERQKRKDQVEHDSPTPSRTPTPPRDIQQRTESLAERNAKRFGQESTQPVFGKDTIQPESHSREHHQSFVSVAPVQESEREELEHAVALVGTCRHMCPDDELLRRQQENDIQALEVPRPGTLHPSNWTLRNTAVKRFRRSAADYKLDVPEWVRPPDVLERTCAYLEEWVMERDRQGPDPRFPQGGTPPPLDVYQFVWDRTRMIRKDFILQNFVGTGGLCDARAVRCHERIARWHTMCEHQLSHIPDFVSMQSQQNIQELGQTMKTLNHFYDDALNRSTIEVPDEAGIETLDSAAFREYLQDSHSKIVQGNDPIDYDGNELNNSQDSIAISGRLIGERTFSSPAHGTAEPEMRALYILLTMDNEGGMEVLKYAARLFKERPAVYQSTPVQLALEIFKSKKELNYVKFFAYLRSSKTPYLFSCIMFKHVELMRKVAFRIMSMTYGARSKETGEAMYDQYPLDTLVKLLCFEDQSEAREACEFYNITLQRRQSQNGEVRDIIYWRASKFKEPRDPEKGHVLRLQPRKMIRTIEKKLRGTTRLGVCRGEVSGDGAALYAPTTPNEVGQSVTSPGVEETDTNPTEFYKPEAGFQPVAVTEKVSIVNRFVKQSDEGDEAEEQRKRMEAVNRKDERTMALERLNAEKAQKEIERQQAVAAEKLRLEHEQMTIAATKRKMEQEERARQEIAKAEMEAKKRKEEEERIRLAQEIERREREQHEQREREQHEREVRERQRRIAEQQRQMESEKQKRKREEEIRQKEIQETRLSNEWRDKIDSAKRMLLWKQWRRALMRPLEMRIGSSRSTIHIDPGILHQNRASHCLKVDDLLKTLPSSHLSSSRQVIETILDKTSVSFSLAEMVWEAIRKLGIESVLRDEANEANKSTLLFKVAIVCPETVEIADESFSTLILQWIGSCVKFGSIEIRKDVLKGRLPLEVRCITVKGSTRKICESADVCLVVVPPRWCSASEKLSMLGPYLEEILPIKVRRVALVLSDQTSEAWNLRSANDVSSALSGEIEQLPIVRPPHFSTASFGAALELSFQQCAKVFVNECFVCVTRISPLKFTTDTMLSILRLPLIIEYSDALVHCTKLVVEVIMQEFEVQFRRNKALWAMWPPSDFAIDLPLVPSYFNDTDGLPVEWWKALLPENVQLEFGPCLDVFRGHFRDVLQRILIDAPSSVRDECVSYCIRGQCKLGLEKALSWLQGTLSRSCQSYIYLPDGLQEVIFEKVLAKIRGLPILMESKREPLSPILLENGNGSDKRSLSNQTYDVEDICALDSQKEETDRPKKKRRPTSPTGTPTHSERVSLPPHERKMVSPVASEKTTDIEMESDAFTKKLERLVQGEVIDMIVGDTRLSHMLADSPGLNLPI
ncbi:SAC3/GANP family protein [Nitzschia inconspicua]|uniref:SAC3/GANP family protein n=1 Tax=Nitzschia inconspicua TaxID=303405 RepID=A0A9K3LG52_9STRA|nr:SAC3/GANP family protein [Nitzschia inconspicua]